MRVLAGSARGVPLLTLPGEGTRPILDRVKKSFFMILQNAGYLEATRVLDLYAGTGVQGLEALSRGAAWCCFVERNPAAVKLLRQNLAKTRLTERAEVRPVEVSAALAALRKKDSSAAEPFEVVLYDPPFAFSREAGSRAAAEAEMAAAGGLLSATGRLILRSEARAEPPRPAGLTLARRWTDGPHALLFYAMAPEPRLAECE